MEKLISTGPEKVIFLDIDGVLNSNRSTEPIIAEDMCLSLDNDTYIETVMALSKLSDAEQYRH